MVNKNFHTKIMPPLIENLCCRPSVYRAIRLNVCLSICLSVTMMMTMMMMTIIIIIIIIIVWKMHLLTLWPWPLTFQPQYHVISTMSQVHSLYQLWTLWDHSFLSYAVDRQTDKQTDGDKHPTHADRLC